MEWCDSNGRAHVNRAKSFTFPRTYRTESHLKSDHVTPGQQLSMHYAVRHAVPVNWVYAHIHAGGRTYTF